MAIFFNKLSKSEIVTFSITVLAFIFLFSVSIWQLIDIFTDYFNQPTNTLVVVESANKIRYPIITTCREASSIGVDYKQFKEDFNVLENTLKIVLLGAGFLATGEYWGINFIGELPPVSDWKTHQKEYQDLLHKLNMTLKHVTFATADNITLHYPKTLSIVLGTESFTMPASAVICFDQYCTFRKVCALD